MLKLLLPYPWRCRDTGDKLCIYAKTHLTPFARIDRVGPDMGMTTVRTMTAAPEMLELLIEALNYEALAFERDEPVSGADLVAWFTQWRAEAKRKLEGVAP